MAVDCKCWQQLVASFCNAVSASHTAPCRAVIAAPPFAFTLWPGVVQEPETQADGYLQHRRRSSVPAEELMTHVQQIRSRVVPFLGRVAAPADGVPAAVVVSGENFLQMRHVFDTVLQVWAVWVSRQTRRHHILWTTPHICVSHLASCVGKRPPCVAHGAVVLSQRPSLS